MGGFIEYTESRESAPPILEGLNGSCPPGLHKGCYPHHMLKEIYEQPQAVSDALDGCLRPGKGEVVLPDLALDIRTLALFERICLVASGTSWHAALVGKYLIEEHCRVPVEVDMASEYSCREPLVTERTLVVPISPSGETPDALAALRVAQGRGGRVLAICGGGGSTLAREADGAIFTGEGPEIGIASTKGFMTQLTALYLLALALGRASGAIDAAKGREMVARISGLPELLEQALLLNPRVDEVACEYLNTWDAIFLARGISFPIALEGALKLKEMTSIHAEGYPAGEMKHGPIALIDREMPVITLAPRDRHYPKVRSNLEEVMARGGRTVVFCTEGDRDLERKVEFVLHLPRVGEDLQPMIQAVPLQLLAYHIAVLKGKRVDRVMQHDRTMRI